MAKHGRIVIIPHRRAEPDLDQIVLALLRALDDQARPEADSERPEVLGDPADRQAS